MSQRSDTGQAEQRCSDQAEQLCSDKLGLGNDRDRAEQACSDQGLGQAQAEQPCSASSLGQSANRLGLSMVCLSDELSTMATGDTASMQGAPILGDMRGMMMEQTQPG